MYLTRVEKMRMQEDTRQDADSTAKVDSCSGYPYNKEVMRPSIARANHKLWKLSCAEECSVFLAAADESIRVNQQSAS